MGRALCQVQIKETEGKHNYLLHSHRKFKEDGDVAAIFA
jgi:hypothetical protein